MNQCVAMCKSCPSCNYGKITSNQEVYDRTFFSEDDCL